MDFKRKQYILIFSLFTLCIFILSYGFSSFIVGNNAGNNQYNVNFNIGNTIDASSYLKLNINKGDNNSGLVTMKYNSMGFVQNETIGYDTSMDFYIEFDTYKYYQDTNKNSISLHFILMYSNTFTTSFSLLTTDYFKPELSSVTYVETSDGSNYDDKLLVSLDTAQYEIIDSNKTIQLNFEYVFDRLTNDSSFNTYFELKFCFNVSSEKFSDIYSNELDLPNNKAKYELNVEIL